MEVNKRNWLKVKKTFFTTKIYSILRAPTKFIYIAYVKFPSNIHFLKHEISIIFLGIS